MAFAALCVLAAACQEKRDPPKSESPASDEAWWEVENQTKQEFVELNLTESPVVAEDWGPNQLGDETTLPASELFRLRLVPCPRAYDQRAVGAEGGAAYRYEVEFGCEDIVNWEVADFE